MLAKEIIEEVNSKTKEINKLKDIDIRIAEMIKIKNNIRYQINDELDELFSKINIKRTKINLEEDE